MPYAYRRMTRAEREAVVHWRREQGWPLHAPPHPIRQAGTYILTAATFEHAPLMAEAERRSEFSGRLLTSLQEIGAEMFAWVVLPNHYHVLATVRSLDGVSAALGRLHGSTSRTWNVVDGRVGRRVWYHFADRLIRNDGHFFRAISYIHGNAVKHGHAATPEEWRWSSLHDYLLAERHEWLRRIEARYPGDGLGRGWDDG